MKLQVTVQIYSIRARQAPTREGFSTLEEIAAREYHRCMAINQMNGFDESATRSYAHLFQALADPTRLAVVQHLASGEHRVRDLVEHMGLAQSTISKHLRFLVECGLVVARPEGRATWYDLAEPALLKILVAAAEKMLEATGHSVQLCAHLRAGGQEVRE